MPFLDRRDAGRKLAKALAQYEKSRPVVLALPRGGVPVAAEVAAALDAPLDLVLVRKIGLPVQPELAMGAVVDGGSPTIVRNEDVIETSGVTASEFNTACQKELAEIERRRHLYLGSRRSVPIEGRTVIIVDDGIATGATVRAALKALLKRQPSKLVLAVPVAAPDTLAELRLEADAVVCLEAPRFFGAIGQFYDDFRQVHDQEVIDALAVSPSDVRESSR